MSRYRTPERKMIPNYPVEDQCIVTHASKTDAHGKPYYIVITRDRSAWNPETEKWLNTNGWPRIVARFPSLNHPDPILYFSVSGAWNRAFADDTIKEVPEQGKRNLLCCGFLDYWVTRDGRVWSDYHYQWLKPSTANSAREYGQSLGVTLCKNGQRAQVLVHSLVAEAFELPNPHNYMFIKHIDEDYTNCAFDNLEWSVTSGGGPNNQIDDDPTAAEADFIKRQVAKIKPINGIVPDPTMGTIVAIINLRKEGWTTIRLAKATGLSRTTINCFFRMYESIDSKVKKVLPV